MLLDVISNSTLLQSILKSVTVPANSLGMVFYLFIVTGIIYAHFGLAHFEPYLSYNTDTAAAPDTPGCHSAVSCFWLIMYKAVPGGTIDSVINDIDNRNVDGAPDYQLRMLYDMVFFIWVGILLFNIITGLMLDTFG